MYTGIGINFQRAIPADMNSPYTIAGLVPAVSPNEHESDVKNLVPTREKLCVLLPLEKFGVAIKI